MTAKFEAFKAALQALCIEHNVRLYGGDDYGDYGVYLEAACDAYPAGVDLDITDRIPLTPEERAAEDVRRAEEYATHQARLAKVRAEEEKRYAAALNSKDYIALREAIEAHAKEIRKSQLRVSTDPNDPAYIDDRPRKVWLNDAEVTGWIVADEFRRSVITPAGVQYGAVLIERLPDDAEPVTEVVLESNSHLCGIFVSDKQDAPVEEPVAPSYAQPGVVEVKAANIFSAPLKGNIEVRPVVAQRSSKNKKRVRK